MKHTFSDQSGAIDVLAKKVVLVLILGLSIVASSLVVSYYWVNPDNSSLPISAQSQIEKGEINHNTTFLAQDSPYHFTHDVQVFPEVTLTIEAGVTVVLESNCSLIVQGSLTASGTADNKITFTSSDPSMVIWGSVKFVGNISESFTLKYAEIANATQGVIIDNEYGNAVIENCNIHHNREAGVEFTCRGNIAIQESTVANNKNGIVGIGYLYSQTQLPYPYFASLSNVRLQSNIIHSNSICGVQLRSIGTKIDGSLSDVSFAANSIFNNGGEGVQVIARASMGGDISNVNFTSNVITNNDGHGIELIATSDFGEGFLIHTNFSKNNISSNNRSAVRMESASFLYDVSFSSNIISGNGEVGVNLMAGEQDEAIVYDVNFLDNTFSTNSQEGIRVKGNVTTNITRNIIIQNSYGILYNGTQNNLADFNNITNNTYGMLVYDNATVQAQNNYWGDPTGPYNSVLNSQGKGNSVNGNGTDLKFTPFLLNAPEIGGK